MRVPRRGFLQLFRGGVLAALALGFLSLWAYMSTSLPSHDDPHPAHRASKNGHAVVTAGFERTSHTHETPVIVTEVTAFDDVVATSCKLFCGTDAVVKVPQESSSSCACSAQSCEGVSGDTNLCCASYLLHCVVNDPDALVSAAAREASEAADPRPFPPLHHGPELVYVDAIVIFCNSQQFHAANVGIREFIEWIEYMRYGGVGRFLLYDCTDVAASQPLVQHAELIPYVREGYVKITPWNTSSFGRFASAPLVGTRAAVAADAHLRFGPSASVWRAVLDTTEYPVVVGDTSAGFLTRWLIKQPITIGAVVVSMIVAGGQQTGMSRSASRRALRYEWQTSGVIPDEEMYFVRVQFATGYGRHRVSTSLKHQIADSTAVRAVRFAGPEVREGQPAPRHCLGTADNRGTDTTECIPMALGHRGQVRGGDVAAVLTGLERLMHTNTLFPGIPSQQLRQRLEISWEFDFNGTNHEQLQRSLRQSDAIRSHERSDAMPQAAQVDVLFDENNAVVWPPQGW